MIPSVIVNQMRVEFGAYLATAGRYWPINFLMAKLVGSNYNVTIPETLCINEASPEATVGETREDTVKSIVKP